MTQKEQKATKSPGWRRPLTSAEYFRPALLTEISNSQIGTDDLVNSQWSMNVGARPRHAKKKKKKERKKKHTSSNAEPRKPNANRITTGYWHYIIVDSVMHIFRPVDKISVC